VDFLLLALSCFGLGALHALEPGHGKTVVAAYLIGSKGRVSEAVLLGLVVTLTHSGSVILLGVLSTVAAAYFVPETVQKVLEVVSGLLVVAVGLWMLFLRKPGGHGHEHGHDLDHNHEHPHPHADHAHPHAEQVSAPAQRPGFVQLIALGVSGGIVPCPAALAVLLAAVSLGQFVRGLTLVVVFSCGMALVLIAVGIVMIKAAGFASRYTQESTWARFAPKVSAAVVTLVGLGLTVKAALDVL
jgi:nickel/cobalt transporter (NicO) family protein